MFFCPLLLACVCAPETCTSKLHTYLHGLGTTSNKLQSVLNTSITSKRLRAGAASSRQGPSSGPRFVRESERRASSSMVLCIPPAATRGHPCPHLLRTAKIRKQTHCINKTNKNPNKQGAGGSLAGEVALVGVRRPKFHRWDPHCGWRKPTP